jgi:hypothetical protein
MHTFSPPDIAATHVRQPVRRRFDDENANMTSVVLKQVRGGDEAPRFYELQQEAMRPDWTGDDFKVLATTKPAVLVGLITKHKLADHDLTFAAEALGLADTAIAVAVLVRLTRHASPVVREGAVYGLARHVAASPEARRALELLAAEDASQGVRQAAAEAIEP